MDTVVGRDLVGMTVFSRDGSKVGKIKAVISDDSGARQFLVVGRFLAHDLVIPVDATEAKEKRVVVPRSSSYLNCAPDVRAQGAVSAADADRLETFYHPD
jgi:ribosomal 30S subunit maturation factor RimM